jgi:glycosyltransferase involved in cell wall biosynthesis
VRATFITSTPMNVERGSGTFVGIDTLTRSLRELGWTIDILTPQLHLPVYTAERILFNESLRFRRNLKGPDLSVGFDLDGYVLPAPLLAEPHIASIKGVVADEMRFEKGLTRATMAIQARLEGIHVKKANYVVTTSLYSASRLKDLYGIPKVHAIIPEMIDLAQWRLAFSQCDETHDPAKFIVLCVCRFYPRKRIELLLHAARVLQPRMPTLEIRIIGGGPESRNLHTLRGKMSLANVTIREDIAPSDLIQEYRNCDVFCLPSVQEGFGIVFLEAMASAKPIIAARAAAVPEVVKHGILTAPGNVAEIANAIQDLHDNPSMREDLGQAGREFVQNFDSRRVAKLFVTEITEMLKQP